MDDTDFFFMDFYSWSSLTLSRKSFAYFKHVSSHSREGPFCGRQLGNGYADRCGFVPLEFSAIQAKPQSADVMVQCI